MAIVTRGDASGGPVKSPEPHVTHHLGCGCKRLSNGTYDKAKTCSYIHLDRLARDAFMSPLVSFVCGCVGYCYCGNEAKLRGEG